jgi:hypothetical protein
LLPPAEELAAEELAAEKMEKSRKIAVTTTRIKIKTWYGQCITWGCSTVPAAGAAGFQLLPGFRSWARTIERLPNLPATAASAAGLNQLLLDSILHA